MMKPTTPFALDSEYIFCLHFSAAKYYFVPNHMDAYYHHQELIARCALDHLKHAEYELQKFHRIQKSKPESKPVILYNLYTND